MQEIFGTLGLNYVKFVNFTFTKTQVTKLFVVTDTEHNMAIVIPSKRIYEKNNNKLIENRINKIEVNATEVKPVNEFDKVVYSENIDFNSSSVFEEETNANKDNSFYTVAGTQIGYQYSYVYFNNKLKYFQGHIKIPKVSNNTRITKISKFEFSVFGTVIKADTTGTLLITSANNSGLNFNTPTITRKSSTEKETTFEFPETPETISVQGVSVTGLKEENTYNILENDTEFEIYFRCMVSYVKETLLSTGLAYVTLDLGATVSGSGEYEYYEPSQLRISVYGNTNGIELVEKNLVFGDTTERSAFSVENNELLQTTNYYEGVLVEETENQLQFNANQTLEQYANGKETATLLCSINDYYDELGNKVIDISQEVAQADITSPKMLFEPNDEVIPYIFNSKGEDVPMSSYADKTPKIFVVVGVEPFYDGACWQRLYLLEK